jgi:hypothetical protein
MKPLTELTLTEIKNGWKSFPANIQRTLAEMYPLMRHSTKDKTTNTNVDFRKRVLKSALSEDSKMALLSRLR